MNKEAELFITHRLNKHYSFRPQTGQKEPVNHLSFYGPLLIFVNFSSPITIDESPPLRLATFLA
jgi:hypothetical protein